MTSTDPLWYKDAVFCQLHVKTFCDSGADGVGNFKGLASKLDCLQTLEVDCLRLLPTLSLAVPTTAMTSQTATSIHPTYESLQDFHELLEAAHARRLKVISELEPYSQHLHEPRGTDPSTPASRFVVCLRNHDQGGNRAVGERLNHQIDLAAFRAASVVRLTTPQAPLLFMGQEGPASSPFQYLTYQRGCRLQLLPVPPVGWHGRAVRLTQKWTPKPGQRLK